MTDCTVKSLPGVMPSFQQMPVFDRHLRFCIWCTLIKVSKLPVRCGIMLDRFYYQTVHYLVLSFVLTAFVVKLFLPTSFFVFFVWLFIPAVLLPSINIEFSHEWLMNYCMQWHNWNNKEMHFSLIKVFLLLSFFTFYISVNSDNYIFWFINLSRV